ncbi:MAG: GNAT family N-acetyltransferase [Clostridia bacterium]|jgi:ribosomal-protein-alanine N-acetyltransferase|nr:GNAT family N-acetyltransferase [Clostridia bacterium]
MKYYFETDRLIAKPISENDAPAVFQWSGDPEVNRYMIYPLHRNIGESESWIASLKAEDNVFGFSLRGGTLIGSGHVCPCKEEPLAWVVGYNFRRDCWGKGYATEAVKGMISWARENFGVKEFVSSHAVANIGSQRVQEKCGFIFDHACEYQKWDGSKVFPAVFRRLKF